MCNANANSPRTENSRAISFNAISTYFAIWPSLETPLLEALSPDLASVCRAVHFRFRRFHLGDAVFDALAVIFIAFGQHFDHRILNFLRANADGADQIIESNRRVPNPRTRDIARQLGRNRLGARLFRALNGPRRAVCDLGQLASLPSDRPKPTARN